MPQFDCRTHFSSQVLKSESGNKTDIRIRLAPFAHVYDHVWRENYKRNKTDQIITTIIRICFHIKYKALKEFITHISYTNTFKALEKAKWKKKIILLKRC